LFDAAPTLVENRLGPGEDRLVAAWGCSRLPAGKRDRGRLARFLPSPPLWSGSGRDRGHFIAHAAGGDTDLNLFPQVAALNRGHTEEGKRWREMERYAAARPGTPLLVRPVYDSADWTPARWASRFSRSPGCKPSGSQTDRHGAQHRRHPIGLKRRLIHRSEDGQGLGSTRDSAAVRRSRRLGRTGCG
jgi:hypothetical protein